MRSPHAVDQPNYGIDQDYTYRQNIDALVERCPEEYRTDFLRFVLDGHSTKVLEEAFESEPTLIKLLDDLLTLTEHSFGDTIALLKTAQCEHDWKWFTTTIQNGPSKFGVCRKCSTGITASGRIIPPTAQLRLWHDAFVVDLD